MQKDMKVEELGGSFEQQDKASCAALEVSEDCGRLPEVELASGICKVGGEERPLALQMLITPLSS